MGLYIDIYKENKRGKRNHITFIGGNGWPLVTYFENLHNKEFSNAEVKASQDDIRDVIEKCRDIMISYFQNTFEWDKNEWIDYAQATLPISNREDRVWYDKTYVDDLFIIYEELMSIYKEMDIDESIIFEISY